MCENLSESSRGRVNSSVSQLDMQVSSSQPSPQRCLQHMEQQSLAVPYHHSLGSSLSTERLRKISKVMAATEREVR